MLRRTNPSVSAFSAGWRCGSSTLRMPSSTSPRSFATSSATKHSTKYHFSAPTNPCAYRDSSDLRGVVRQCRWRVLAESNATWVMDSRPCSRCCGQPLASEDSRKQLPIDKCYVMRCRATAICWTVTSSRISVDVGYVGVPHGVSLEGQHHDERTSLRREGLIGDRRGERHRPRRGARVRPSMRERGGRRCVRAGHDETARLIEQEGGRALNVRCDVTRGEDRPRGAACRGRTD